MSRKGSCHIEKEDVTQWEWGKCLARLHCELPTNSRDGRRVLRIRCRGFSSCPKTQHAELISGSHRAISASIIALGAERIKTCGVRQHGSSLG